MKAAGGVIAGIGGILVFGVVIWGAAGFYLSQVPIMLLLLAAGGVTAFVGGRMAKGGGRPELAEGARIAGVGYPTPPSVVVTRPAPPAAVVVTEELDSTTTRERLSELATERPDMWDEISAHPNCYDGLREWIAASRLAMPLTSPVGVDELRAADPATPPEALAELAHRRPNLRTTIAANPSAYPALRDWIAEVGQR